MSAIFGIVDLDRGPVDVTALERMGAAMTNRAPDGTNVWCSGHVGLGHAMLRIPGESQDARQPCTLDGQAWITADARIDGRAELVRSLRAAGNDARNDAGDAELILRTYETFGESFLDRIIGDFAFALWDGRRETLICARDHFGVRPFFYARTDRLFLFASDIDAILTHPAVTSRLDDEAIGDFMLFSVLQGRESTAYLDVRRLPGANCLCLVSGALRMRKYWAFPIRTETQFRRDSDLIEEFRDIFRVAVSDRSRADHVAMELSGGIDSTSIAAVVAPVAKLPGGSVRAFTRTCDDLLPDDREGQFARLAASYLSIPLSLHSVEPYALFERSDDPRMGTAEPWSSCMQSADRYEFNAQVVNCGARILLSGQGGDGVFNCANTYYPRLLRQGRIVRLLRELYRHVYYTGSLAGTGLRSALLGSFLRSDWRPVFPKYLNEDFVRHTDLKERWKVGWRTIHSSVGICSQLQAPVVAAVFSDYEALRMPLAARHPFFDLRVVEFLLGLPSYLRSGKRIMREAFRGILPEPILTRPKTPLAGDHLRVKFATGRLGISMESNLSLVGERYVDVNRYLQYFEEYMRGEGMESTYSSMYVANPVSLNVWLSQRAAPDW